MSIFSTLRAHWARVLVIAAILVTAAVASFVLLKSREQIVPTLTGDAKQAAAFKAGKQLSSGLCEGTGPGRLTALPMRPDDFTLYIPYGLVVGGHVTPIDHAYFAPRDYRSPRDAYPVYAMADATITDITTRDSTVGGTTGVEYRLVFTISCTFFYYYDLVTNLTPEIKAEYESKRSPDHRNRRGSIRIPVKAGQEIGRIGTRTLDFAVWDTTKPLAGFIRPESYEMESWKVYTADPYPYLSDEIRTLLTARNPRTAPPIAGRIDYDQDGKLIGNWFREGSGGYGGPPGSQGREGYWAGHLSFAPNHWDPTRFMISIGDWQGEASQFVARGNTPDPATVSPATGLVKYELTGVSYTGPAGERWDGMSLIKGPKAVEGQGSRGTVLVQMLENRKLKFETFPGKSAAQVSAFTADAIVYER